MHILNTPDMNISGIWGQIYSISILVTFVVSLLLSLFVLTKGYQERLKQYWFLLTLSVSGWAIFIFFWSRAVSYADAYTYNYTANLFAIFIALFAVVFTEEYAKKKSRALSLIALIGGLTIFVFALVFKDLFIPSLSPKVMFRMYPDSGLIYYFQAGYFVLCWIYALFTLFRLSVTGTSISRKQVRLILTGLIISLIGGSVNYFPLFGINVFPVTSSFTAFYVVMTTIAIIRYRAFEIDTVIHRTFLWALTSVLIMLPMGLILLLGRPFLSGMNLAWLTIFAVTLFYINLAIYRVIQPKIDHLFRRRKYDYQKLMAGISRKLGSELDIGLLAAKLLSEFQETLYIRNGFLLARNPMENQFVSVGSLGYAPNELTPLGYFSGLLEWLETELCVLDKKLMETDDRHAVIKAKSLQWMEASRVEVVIPLVAGRKLAGILCLGLKDNLQKYTNKDIEILGEIGLQMGITLQNAVHHAYIVDRERIASELKLGREIQMNLLPRKIPQVAGLRLAGFSIPAMEIGGDYFDYLIPLDTIRSGTLPDSVSVVIGDVSGKGVGAGLIMSAVKAVLKELCQQDLSPKEVLGKINNLLMEYTQGEKFMTMLYLEWSNGSKKIRYSSAGHEHIILYRDNGEIEVILSGGFILGVRPDIDNLLEDRSLEMLPGDKVVIYTDGVTEAMDPETAFYGLDRLTRSVKTHGKSRSAKELLDLLKNDLFQYMNGQKQSDDITMVILEAV